VDPSRLRRAHVEDHVQGRHIGHLDQRLFASTAAPSTAVMPCDDDAGPSGARRVASCCAAPRRDRRHLRLRQVRGRPGRCPSGAGFPPVPVAPPGHRRRSALRERGLRAARRRVERRPLELDQGIALCHALAGGDEDARHPCGRRGRAPRSAPVGAVTVPMALTSCGKDCFVATAVSTPPTVCSEGGVSAAALAWRSPRQAVSIRAAATSDALAFMADRWR